eukprot:TRINITY_DN675_c0_g1_i3.p1 TRINITY_DN675_c0_g1~~TRINITY_DN675_c0_g1_i3.p1  ORF type:complete len:107 (-),score=21.11 TRINITY_DN675_c0_g1_i3:208-492(-)
MARRAMTPIVLCALVAALVLTSAWSFVGAPSKSSYSLRATQRKPEVAMNFFGGEPVTTTTPPPAIEADGTYVIGITLFFFASVAANANGFFGPW